MTEQILLRNRPEGTTMALRVPGRHPAVDTWAAAVPIAVLHITAFTVAEIERGVRRKAAMNPTLSAALRRWFSDGVLAGSAGRVLWFDRAAARALARHPVPHDAPLDEALIAAVAEAHGMTVVTRNVRHFDPRGMRTLDPWEPPL